MDGIKTAAIMMVIFIVAGYIFNTWG